MKTHKILILSILFCTLFSFASPVNADVQIPEIKGAEKVKPMKITNSDIANYELMLKSSKFDPKLSNKVREYIVKLKNNIFFKFNELREVLLQKGNWQLESVKIPAPPVDKTGNETAEDENDDKLKMIDSGKRLTTTVSVNVNRQIDNLQPLIDEYKSVLFEFLKYNYSQTMEDLKIRETTPEKTDEKTGKTIKETVVETPLIQIITKKWSETEKLMYVEAYKELKKHTLERNLGTLIDEKDEEFCVSLEEFLTRSDEFKAILIKATFRGGWSEFGSGWIMLIFGILTLYGGLTLTFILDFRSRRKGK